MRSQTPPTVFVVDDDDDSRDHLFRLARSCGWYAAGYRSEQMCEGALPILAADCILLVLTPPDLSGLNVLDALRQRGTDTPVIAVIADAEADSIRRASDAGMRVMLRKPVERDRLRKAVEQVITRHHASIANEPIHGLIARDQVSAQRS